KHWNVAAEKSPGAAGPALEAKLWAVGQAITGQAALELLEHRARSAGKAGHPWPEFAEYDCYACHHSLQEPSPRQSPRPARFGLKVGQLPWGTWYFPLVDHLNPQGPASDAPPY